MITLKRLKALWSQLIAPEDFIGVTTDDRTLGAVPPHQPVFPMQVWMDRFRPDGGAGEGDMYIESVDTDEDSVTFAPVLNPGDSRTQNRKMFLRHYQPAHPAARYDPALSEVVPLA